MENIEDREEEVLDEDDRSVRSEDGVEEIDDEEAEADALVGDSRRLMAAGR